MSSHIAIRTTKTCSFYVPGEEYWMGLENIYQITNSKPYTLRITMKSFGSTEKKIAIYKTFKLTENVILVTTFTYHD